VIAVIGGVLAALCFTGAILSSTRATRMVGPVATLGGVMLVSALAAAPIVLVSIAGTPFPSASIGWLVLAGVGNVGGLFSEYVGLRRGKVGIVGALAAAEGAVAASLSILAGEQLAPAVGIGVAIVAGGVVLTALAPDPPDGRSPPGALRAAVLFGGIAGLAFGGSLYATGRLGASLPIGWALVAPRVVGVAAITLPAFVTGRLRVDRSAWRYIIVGGCCETGGFLAFAWASGSGIAVASALAAQFATLGAVVAWLRFGERLSRWQWLGVGTVAVGVVLLAFGST
jgi:drug/metabolite transporter (DMT)-like permease